MIEASLHVLLVLLIASSLGLAVIALLRPVMEQRCGAIAALQLWWLLPVTICVAALPKWAGSAIGTTSELIVQAQHAVQGAAEPIVLLVLAPSDGPAIAWQPYVLAAWLLGALATMARLIHAQRRFMRQISWRSSRRGELPVQAGPAVVGALAPRLLLPADFKSRYAAEERRLILLHEAIHLRRRDGLVNLAMLCLLVLQWFNPLVHWAVRALARDQESACDAAVVKRHPHALKTYADALLKAQVPRVHLPLASYWHAYHPTVERISMLKKHRDTAAKPRLSWAVLLFSAVLTSLAVYAGVPSLTAMPVPVRAEPLSQPAGTAQTQPLSVLPDAAQKKSRGESTATMPPAALLKASSASQEREQIVTASAAAGTGGRVTLRLREVTLQNFVDVLSRAKGLTFEGVENLQGSKFTISFVNVPVNDLIGTVFGCQGYALVLAGNVYKITKSDALPVAPDPTACAASRLASYEGRQPMVSPDSAQGGANVWVGRTKDGLSLDTDGIQLKTLVLLLSKNFGIPVEGADGLEGSPFSVHLKSTSALELMRVALACQGYALVQSDNGYKVKKSTEVQTSPDPTVCVANASARPVEKDSQR